MSFYNNNSFATLPNDTGATLTGTEYLVTNQAEIFEAPYTIELFVRPEARTNTNGYARLIGVAPSGDTWGNTYGYTLFGHGSGGTTDMALAHGGSIFESGDVKMTITDFFANDDSREDKHIVLSVDSGSMTLHCKSASTSTSLTYPTTCLLYTSPSPRDNGRSRMPSSA